MKLLWKPFYVWAGSWLCWGVCIVETESGLKCWNWQLWPAAYYIDSIHSNRNLAAYYSNSEQQVNLVKTYKCKFFAALVGLF